MLISTWSDKGGTGKTTLAIVAASYFEAPLLDLDPQGDVARWAERAGAPFERLDQDGAQARLIEAATSKKLYVVDCPPGRDPYSLQGMAFSQAVIIPTRSGDADLVALGRALDVVKEVQANGNPTLKATVVLNATRDTARARGIAQALRVTKAYHFLGEIKERLAYEEAYSTGKTVLTQPGPAALEAEAAMQSLKLLLKKS